GPVGLLVDGGATSDAPVGQAVTLADLLALGDVLVRVARIGTLDAALTQELSRQACNRGSGPAMRGNRVVVGIATPDLTLIASDRIERLPVAALIDLAVNCSGGCNGHCLHVRNDARSFVDRCVGGKLVT